MFQNDTKVFAGQHQDVSKGNMVSQGSLHIVPRQPPITSQGDFFEG
jgi:hypothetical protein